jgi:hypothetical protein
MQVTDRATHLLCTLGSVLGTERDAAELLCGDVVQPTASRASEESGGSWTATGLYGAFGSWPLPLHSDHHRNPTGQRIPQGFSSSVKRSEREPRHVPAPIRGVRIFRTLSL